LWILSAVLLSGILIAVYAGVGRAQEAKEDACVACHLEKTPLIVKDWLESRHAQSEKRRATCRRCHGSAHDSEENTHLAKMPTAKTCRVCHLKRYKQYVKGKHALAWDVMNAMPMTHRLPREETKGMKGCGGCHKVGNITMKDVEPDRFGPVGCAACHGRHKFSKQAAQDPRLCAACHTGIDHPQWEMWSTSKHGIARMAKGGAERAPSCQNCHFPDSDHENITAWGFLAVRLPEDDPKWMADRVEILKAFGLLDAEGKPTALLPLVDKLKLARTTKKAFVDLREKMIGTCRRCHGEAMVRERFKTYDKTVREADRLFAKAIVIVRDLYKDGLIAQREGTPVKGYPFVLDFYDVKTSIEEKLYLMFEEYRMRAIQGAFHDNWDYHHWRGYAKMIKTLVEMEEKARDMRAKGEKKQIK
jgi:nitrate/TMAO reductase-like tetraheme cytochrome c subunit